MNGEEHVAAQFREAVSRDDIEAASQILFRLTMWGSSEDEETAYFICQECLRSPHTRLRANGIQAIGHIARVYGRLDDQMKPVIERALADPDPDIRTQAESAVMDTNGYLGWQFPDWKPQ